MIQYIYTSRKCSKEFVLNTLRDMENSGWEFVFAQPDGQETFMYFKRPKIKYEKSVEDQMAYLIDDVLRFES